MRPFSIHFLKVILKSDNDIKNGEDVEREREKKTRCQLHLSITCKNSKSNKGFIFLKVLFLKGFIFFNF